MDVRRRITVIALGLVAIGAAGATIVGARLLSPGGGASGASTAARVSACPQPLPQGSTLEAARLATALFVRTVVLRAQPGCGYDLSSERLRGVLAPERWASGDTPVRPFVSRHPPTAYADASSDPDAPEAVYVISRDAGLTGYPLEMLVGVAAPDAGTGAYRLLLVLDERGDWRVDRWWRVAISSRDF